MTKFNPNNKKALTYGEALEPAMKITDPEDARQYLDDYISFQEKNMSKASGNHTAEEICKINLGYFAGYYDNKTRERVEKLFNCSHPIFGSIKKNDAPTSEKAFSMGQQAGANHKNN